MQGGVHQSMDNIMIAQKMCNDKAAKQALSLVEIVVKQKYVGGFWRINKREVRKEQMKLHIA